MTTVNYQVGAGGDDGYASDGEPFNVSGTAYYIGYYFLSGAYTTFLRFTGVTIPAGSTINSAKLQLYLYQGYSSCTVKIYADDQSNPSAPTTSSNLLGRTKTTNYASATGPTSGTWWDSPSLVSVIQELVDSYSYASGSAMQFIIVNNSASNSCSFFSYNYGSSYGAKLIIEYTAPSGSVVPVIMSQYRRRW